MTDALDISEELVARFEKGDNDALGKLFSHYRERLRRIVRFRMDDRLAGRVSESDVIQESYISASKRVDHYRDQLDMPFFLWLRLLINQQLADIHRHHLKAEKRDVRKEIALAEPNASPHTSRAMAAQLVGKMTSPSRAFSRVERMATLEAVLNRMEPLDREVIALRHFEELTNAETARVLKITVQAASKRYVRAIKRMKELLSELPGFA